MKPRRARPMFLLVAVLSLLVGANLHAQSDPAVQTYLTTDRRYAFDMPLGDWIVTEDDNITITNSRRDFSAGSGALSVDEFVAFIILPEEIALLGFTPYSTLDEVRQFLPNGKFTDRIIGGRTVLEQDQSSPNGDFRTFYLQIPEGGLAAVGLVTATDNFETFRPFAEQVVATLRHASLTDLGITTGDALATITDLDLHTVTRYTKLYVTDDLNLRFGFPPEYDIIELEASIALQPNPSQPDDSDIHIAIFAPTQYLYTADMVNTDMPAPNLTATDPETLLLQWADYFRASHPTADIQSYSPVERYRVAGRDFLLSTVRTGLGDVVLVALALSPQDAALVTVRTAQGKLPSVLRLAVTLAAGLEINE